MLEHCYIVSLIPLKIYVNKPWKIIRIIQKLPKKKFLTHVQSTPLCVATLWFG